jgi:hypothetical protein
MHAIVVVSAILLGTIGIGIGSVVRFLVNRLRESERDSDFDSQWDR